MTELEKFSTCDLLKTFDKIGEQLSKTAPDKMREIITKYGGADMATNKVAKEAKDYDPNEKTPKTSVEETKKPAETSESHEADAKIGKDGGMPPMGGNGGDDDMSPGTQADVLQQILEAIQDLRAMVAQVAGGNGNGEPEVPTEEVQMSAQPQVEKEAPVPTAPASEKQIASIVVKAIEDKFKELGIVKTAKPKEDSGHPIAKANPSMEDMGKMSWADVHALNDKRRPPNFYEMIYGHSMD